MAHRVFITGAAGYVGAMLCDHFARRPDVECIVALDKEPMPELLRGNPKTRWISANTIDPSWPAQVAGEHPDVVVHAAWQIREMYGRQALQRAWNVGGADAVFDFAFNTRSVKRLVHFSSVAPYGARSDNSIARRFMEDDAFRTTDFRYAEEKRIVERQLERKFAQARAKGSDVAVAVMRPAAIAGPRGRDQRTQLLLSALSEQTKSKTAYRLPSLLGSFIPVTANWCRQFLHEDDLADIAALLAFGAPRSNYEIVNASPPGDVVHGADLAQAFAKRAIRIHPQLVRLAFFLAWHGTRGRISTPRGAWRSYSYPVVVDGSKLSATYGYRYRVGSKDAVTRNLGHYAGASPAGAPAHGLAPAE